MRHFGDITKIKGSEVPIVDVVTGGSPCQDLSCAGKRAGLSGERSGLFMEQIRVVKEMREYDRANRGTDGHISGIRPRYMVWENVPGAFSSNKGKDFQAVLTEIARIVCKDCPDVPLPQKGKWAKSGCLMGYGDDGQPFSIAYRLHDAQFWGVPQRRKRIALVADFGGTSAPEILFERESVSGNTEQSEQTGEETSGTVGEGTDSSSKRCSNIGGNRTDGGEEWNSYTLKIRGGVDVDSYGKKAGKGPLIQTELSGTLGVSQDQTLITKCISIDEKMGNTYVGDDMGNTLGAKDYKQPQAVVYGISPYDSNAMKSNNPHSGIYKADTSRTLDLNGGSPTCNQGGMAIVQGCDVYNGELTGETAATLTSACGGTNTSGAKVVCLEGNGQRDSHKGDGYKESETMYTLNTVEQHAICVDQGAGKSSCQVEVEKSPTLATTHDGAPAVCTYQKTTGSLCASGYDKLGTQEAANDMYIVQSCSWDGSQVSPTLTKNNAGGEQRMPDKDNFNAVVQSMEVFHCTSEEDKVQTLKAIDYKDPQIVAYGVDCYNQTQAEEVTQPLRSINADNDHVPCVYGVNSYNQSAELEKMDTLKTNGGGDSSPKVCIAESPIAFQGQAGAEASLQVGEDLSPTLLSGKNAMVSYGLDRASFNQGKNALYDFSVEEEKAQTLVSRGPGGVLTKQ